MRQIGIAAAAASCTALVLLVSGHSHAVPATKKEQSSGLQGRADHLKRVLHAKRSGMRFVVRHRARYDGTAGRMYWHLYGEAAKARRRLERVRRELARRQQSSLWAVLWAKWRPVIMCETGNTLDWRWGAPGHPADGFQGGPNFHPGTWDSYRGSFAAEAYDASPLQQLIVAERVLAAQGPQAWPVCAARAGWY